MRNIPVDVSRLVAVVVGEPKAAMKDGQPSLDRDTGVPQWNLDLTLIGEGGADTVRLQLPENGFPKGLAIGLKVVLEGMTIIYWDKGNGNHGLMFKARSLRVEGGQAAVKAAAA